MTLITMKEKRYYPYDPGGALFIRLKENHTHFYHKDEKINQEFFKDLHDAYMIEVDKHPNRMEHMTGLERIPIPILTVKHHFKDFGYQELFPTFSLSVDFGQVEIDQYITGHYEREIMTFEGRVLTQNLMVSTNQPFSYYRLIENQNFMDYDEGGEFPDVEVRLFDFIHSKPITKEEFYFHVSFAREQSTGAKNLNETIRILCEKFGYHPFVSDYSYSLTEGTSSEDDFYKNSAKFDGISHDINYSLLKENVPLFIL